MAGKYAYKSRSWADIAILVALGLIGVGLVLFVVLDVSTINPNLPSGSAGPAITAPQNPGPHHSKHPAGSHASGHGKHGVKSSGNGTHGSNGSNGSGHSGTHHHGRSSTPPPSRHTPPPGKHTGGGGGTHHHPSPSPTPPKISIPPIHVPITLPVIGPLPTITIPVIRLNELPTP